MKKSPDHEINDDLDRYSPDEVDRLALEFNTTVVKPIRRRLQEIEALPASETDENDPRNERYWDQHPHTD